MNATHGILKCNVNVKLNVILEKDVKLWLPTIVSFAQSENLQDYV